MKIVIPGGKGHVGNLLTQSFRKDGHSVTVLSRSPTNVDPEEVFWDGRSLGAWTETLEGADVVINLAGKSVNCRYTPVNRRKIMDSRVESTRIVGEAIANAKVPPRVWLQASTATIYEHSFDEPNDEVNGRIGGSEPRAPDTWRFSIDVATAWERAANEAETRKTRMVLMRSAIILSPERDGIFDVLLGLVRMGAGGKTGSGRQMVSWVHGEDFVRAVYRLIEDERFSGPVNIASPNPLSNARFMKELREAWGIPLGIPSPEWLLEIASFIMRTESELVLKSRYVLPRLLTDAGFEFEFPEWKETAEDLCERWRAGG